MSAGSSVRSLPASSLKATRNEIDQVFRVGSISCLTAHHYQSFDFNSPQQKVASPNATKIGQAHPWSRGSIQLHLAGLRRAKKKKNKISSSRGRQKTKDVSSTSESTYRYGSKARELKVPDGSSVRPLPLRALKATRNEIDKIFRVGSISCLIAHHHQSFDLNSPHQKVALPNETKLAKLIYRAQALSSCITLGLGQERRPKYQAEMGEGWGKANGSNIYLIYHGW